MHIASSSKFPLGSRQGIAIFVAAVSFQVLFMLVLASLSHFGLFGDFPGSFDALFSPFGAAVQVLITNSALVLLALIPVRMNNLTFLKAFHVIQPSRLFTLVAIAGVVPLGIIVDEISFGLHVLAPTIFNTQGLDQMVAIFTDASPAGFALASLAISLGPALGEEVMFRGLILRSFRNDMSPLAAVVGSSILFGIMHFNALQGTGAALIGLYFGFVALAGGSIWPAVAAHAVNNMICAIAARYAYASAGTAFSHGHPLWLLATASIIFIIILTALIAFRRRT